MRRVYGGNLMEALKRVRSNRGAPGVDGMTVEALSPYLKEHWPRIREELLNETYAPQPIRRVEIPKPDGKGVRLLGIPTVLDRLIQQSILQVLTPVFDPHFSESSYGFRPGRGCHDAVVAARAHVEAGSRFVVDMDLEKFFDRVNHDALMARVARRVGDKRLLRLTSCVLRRRHCFPRRLCFLYIYFRSFFLLFRSHGLFLPYTVWVSPRIPMMMR